MLFVLIAAIFGGLTGLVFFQVPGMIVGALIGYGLTYGFWRTIVKRGMGILQSQYLDSAFALMGSLCKADESITDDGNEAAKQVFDRLELNDEQRGNAQAAFDRGRADDFKRNDELAALRRIGGSHRTYLPLVLQLQSWALGANGEISEQELTTLISTGRNMHLREVEVQRLAAMFRSRSGEQRIEDAYAVLGFKEAASPDEVDKASQALLKQLDADKLIAQGLPEAMRPVIEERASEIRRAHETIRAAHQPA
jgi:DnaJ like chaperone protein